MVSSGGVRDLFAPPMTVAAASGEPGVLLLRSAEELGEYPVTVMHSLRAWATVAPNYPLVAERDRGGWRTVSYGRTVAAADSIGQALLERGLGPGRPLLVLSGNGVDHLLVTLGAMTAGIPVAPASVAYSLQLRARSPDGGCAAGVAMLLEVPLVVLLGPVERGRRGDLSDDLPPQRSLLGVT
jgi:hypothetical protein